MTETPVEEIVDLSDLDLLDDDDTLHMRCTKCTPDSEAVPGMLVVAICGARVLVPPVPPNQLCKACTAWVVKSATCPNGHRS